MLKSEYLQRVYSQVVTRDPDQKEFHQAVLEVLESLDLIVDKHPEYEANGVIESFVEPERVVTFRVPWVDDEGHVQVNRGYRVQFNSAIGPYKGGLRFHPTVNLSILKFLGFEQILKNSLTGLPIGGAKGGSDFDPKGKSDAEVMRFCQSFMTELSRHIGQFVDVPAGDIGVGGREIGYLFGQYRRLKGVWENGVLTGKGLSYGGSLARTEATGYGVCYYMNEMLKDMGTSFEGKRVVISGSGNVATYANQKATQLGGKVVAMSDSQGYVYDPKGVSGEKIDYMLSLRLSGEDIVAPYAERYPEATFFPGRKPWEQAVDIALPCATQNELTLTDAEALHANGVTLVAEVSNMGCTAQAVDYLVEHRIPFAPGKAVNSGGVATSGLEMTQNAMHISWSAAEVDSRLQQIMHAVHDQCLQYGREEGYTNYVRGANVAGFMKVARAIMAQGII